MITAGGVPPSWSNRISQTSGGFSSFVTAAAGRGAIYTVALRHYIDSEASEIVPARGLRSIERFELADLGSA